MTAVCEAAEFLVKALSANTATSGATLRAPEETPVNKVTPHAGETQGAFVSRCMSSLSGEFPDEKQRAEACHSMWRETRKKFVRTHVVKVDDQKDHTYVYGAALVPDEPDFQGDVISAAEIEKAAFTFWEKYQNPGLMHEFIVRSDAMVFVESNVAKVPHTIGETVYPAGTWFLGAKVYDDKLRKAVLSGQLAAWSIGGEGNRTPIPTAA